MVLPLFSPIPMSTLSPSEMWPSTTDSGDPIFRPSLYSLRGDCLSFLSFYDSSRCFGPLPTTHSLPEAASQFPIPRHHCCPVSSPPNAPTAWLLLGLTARLLSGSPRFPSPRCSMSFQTTILFGKTCCDPDHNFISSCKKHHL